MERMKMHSRDNVAQNIEAVGRLFPNALTEVMRDGKLVQAIDFDVLRQELSREIVEGREERYAFTWPDKRQAILAANAPIAATLRPIVEDSVGRDGTAGAFDSENLYIEGDNLDVLKLLQETYLGKVKMIYIDPPYNTGNDAFVYDDDFAMEGGDFVAANVPYDEYGNMVYDFKKNLDSNGRFHTDWLNMIYPRLKVVKSLLADDGVIFISIDENEVGNAKKVCEEIYGIDNCVGVISNVSNPKGRSDDKFVATAHEYILIFAKNIDLMDWHGFSPTEEIVKRYNKVDEDGKKYREIDLRKTGENDLREDRPNLFYYFYYNKDSGAFFPSKEDLTTKSYIQIKPQREDMKEGNWRWGLETSRDKISQLIPKFMPSRKVWGVMQKDYLEGRTLVKPTSAWVFKDVNSERGTEEFVNLGFDKRIFLKPKPVGTIKRCVELGANKNALVLDFFSGSATTAHAVMQLNAEDGGSRKFIMVQLPEVTDEKSEAYRAGYANICEIGKERIRRAGAKIAAEAGEKAAGLDLGFRCLRLDTSNMTDVYYAPDAVTQDGLFAQVDNVKADRTPEDLLVQTMLDLGILLSEPITVEEIAGKRVFNVADGFLLACFDRAVTDLAVTAIAKRKPYYAVFRDASMADDSALTNFDQLFAAYSPATVRRVL